MPCTNVDIEVEVITPDQSKKIVFGLVKTCTNEVASWQINFELDEPKDATDTDFGKLVAKVSVKIAPEDHDAAQAIADQKQLSDGQAAQAIATADVLKQHANDPNHPDVEASAVQILHADDAIPADDSDESDQASAAGSTGN